MSTVPRDTWVQIPITEWRRRLEHARAAALHMLASVGLDTDTGDDHPAAMICDGPIGLALRPAIATDRKALEELLDRARSYRDDFHELPDLLVAYEISVAEAAYLFGVIAGCHLTWPFVEAMPAPYAPPDTPRRKKAGAR
jgi:hypothetical protein